MSVIVMLFRKSVIHIKFSVYSVVALFLTKERFSLCLCVSVPLWWIKVCYVLIKKDFLCNLCASVVNYFWICFGCVRSNLDSHYKCLWAAYLQPLNCDFQLINRPMSGDEPPLMSSLKPISIVEHLPVLIAPPNIMMTALFRNNRSVSL